MVSTKNTNKKEPLQRLFFIQQKKLLCNCVLKGLAGFESGNTGCRDADLFLGSGIAAYASIALLGLKRAKTYELDLVALNKSFGNCFESSVDCLLAVFLGKTSFCCNSSNEFGFVHVIPPK